MSRTSCSTWAAASSATTTLTWTCAQLMLPSSAALDRSSNSLRNSVTGCRLAHAGHQAERDLALFELRRSLRGRAAARRTSSRTGRARGRADGCGSPCLDAVVAVSDAHSGSIAVEASGRPGGARRSPDEPTAMSPGRVTVRSRSSAPTSLSWPPVTASKMARWRSDSPAGRSGSRGLLQNRSRSSSSGRP